jgi:hypothetical protein
MSSTQQNTQQYQQFEQKQQQPLDQATLDRLALQNYGATPRAEGYRPAVIRESRIKDRPQARNLKDDSLSIKIELDLEVEVCPSSPLPGTQM